MAKKSGATKQDLKVMEFLRLGGTKIPAGFASKAAAATKSMLQEKLDARNALWKQGAKLYSGLKGASAVAVNDPANKKALNGLLSWHKKIAGKKLAFPKVHSGVGGFFLLISIHCCSVAGSSGVLSKRRCWRSCATKVDGAALVRLPVESYPPRRMPRHATCSSAMASTNCVKTNRERHTGVSN